MNKIHPFFRFLTLILVFFSCSKSATTPAVNLLPDPQNTIKITSSVLTDKGVIPLKYTCHNQTVPYTLPISWSNVPTGTLSFVFILTDLDAKIQPSDNCIIYNISATTTSLLEKQAIGNAALVSEVNAVNTKYYTLPCPSDGIKTHRFQFSIYAINEVLTVPILSYATSTDLLTAIKGKTLAYGTLTGTVDVL